MPRVGSALGRFGLGIFSLASAGSPWYLSGTSRIQVTTPRTQTGVSSITPYLLKTLTGKSNLRATTFRTIQGRTGIISPASVATEYQIIYAAFGGSTGVLTEEILSGLSKTTVVSYNFGHYTKPRKIVYNGQISYNKLSVQFGVPYVSSPLSVSQYIIIPENLSGLTPSQVEAILTGLSKTTVLIYGYGAYRKHRNIDTNVITVGAFGIVRTAEYVKSGTPGLPVIPGTGLTLGRALSQFQKAGLNANKFLPVSLTTFTKFSLFPSTYNAWPAMSSFSGTLAGETYNSTSLMVYDAKATQAVRLAPGGVVPGGFECDGVTNVAFNPSQGSTGDWTATCATSVSITPNATVPNGWECDGQTTLTFTVEYDAYGSIECDGATDVQILSIGGFGWEGDGSTDVEFTTIRQVYGYFNMDGSTDCQIINTASNWTGYPNMDGKTDMSITAAQIYSFGNAFTMDGLTSVSITANQAYGFGIQVNADGSSSCQFITVQRSAVIGFEADGMTAVQFGSVADYFININMDGSTAVTINGAYYPIVQIVCTGVGDSFIDGLVGRFAYLTMDGATNVAISASLQAVGNFLWNSNETTLAVSGAKSTAAYLNMDGATTVNFNPNQDQFGELIVDQMDQELYALGSFVFTDGQLNAVSSSSMTTSSTYYPLGPDYISGIIRLTKNDTGAPDFVPVFTDSFTLGGKTARSQGEGDLGTMIYKRAVGPSRQTSNFQRIALNSNVSYEFIRFPLFVDEDIDFTQISTSVGFTVDGISAVAGYGVVGRDKEEYVTFAVLTNTRLTQEALELLAAGNPNVNLTQVCYEMIFIPNSTERMTQVAEEILYLANLGAIQSEAVETLAAGTGGSGYINLVAVETMASVHANTLMSQTNKEVLATGDPYARISQTSLEALVYSQLVSFSNVWIQAVAVETMMAPEGNLVINAEAVETLHNGAGHADVNTVAIEIINNGNSHADINAVVLEEINNSTTQALCVQGVSVECLVLFETDYTVAGMVNNPRYYI